MLNLNKFTPTIDGKGPLFSPLSFQIAKNTFVQIKGANGIGKSTMLKSLSGLYDKYDGDIFYDDIEIRSDANQWRKQVSYLGHKNGIYEELSVAKNLELASAFHNTQLAIPSAIEHYKLDYHAHKKVRDLSAGLKRRTALARIMLSAEKPIWLLDEPTANLDKESIGQLKSMIVGYCDAGGICISTSHSDSLDFGETIELISV